MRTTWLSTVWLVALGGCGTHKLDLESGGAAGQPVAVDVEVASDGSLHAARVYVSSGEEGDTEEAIPLEDLPAVVTSAMEARWPGATWLSAEKEGSTWGVDFVTVGGEHLEAEFDADGNVIETETADADDDTEDAGRAFVAGTPTADGTVLGLRVVAPMPLPSGAFRAVGRFGGDRTLLCETTATAPSDALSVGGISQGLVPTGDGFTLTVLDVRVAIDAETVITYVEDPLEAGDTH